MRTFKILGKEVFSFGEPEESKVHRTVKNAINIRDGSYPVDELSPKMLRKIALREPLLLKGIFKKNKDTIRNWFVLKPIDGDDSIPKPIEKLIFDFERRTQIQKKLFVGGCAANIYGTGYIERTFIEPKTKKAVSSVDKRAKPLGLNLLNSENFKGRKRKDDKDKTVYYVYKEKGMIGDELFIHPDRIIPVVIDKLPFSFFGISKVHVAANILKSKMDADITSGEILSWFSHGILDMTIDDMNDDQEKDMINLFKQHVNAYVHDEKYHLDVKNPTQIDPKPFYEYFYVNIASALEMPTHMLTGLQLSKGDSEVGVSDYYHDIENIQKVIFTPIIEEIYKNLLETNGYKWIYKIVWNPIFVDELSEAKIAQTRSYSAVNNYNAGIIDIKEARQQLNNGIVDLDVNKKIDKKESEQPAIPDQPNVEPQPPVKKPTVKQTVVIKPLTKEQQRMINEAARREKELGEQILREQEKLFGDKNGKKENRKQKNKRVTSLANKKKSKK